MNSMNLPNEFRAHTYPSFPSRNLIRQKSSNGGAWLVQFRNEQQKHLDTSLASSQHERQQPNQNDPSANKPKNSAVQVLNTFTESYLIKRFLKHVTDRSSICSINLRGQTLHQSSEDEDFSSFKCVVHIDASENRLTLESLKTFSSLCEIDLQLNGITRILISKTDFPNLSILDLSYNNVYEESIPILGYLPSLKCLYLCSNGLKRLPVLDFSLEGSLVTIDCFPALQILHLDDNELTEVSSFSKLAILKRLQVLSLAGNRITCVPHPDETDPNSFVNDNKQWAHDMSTVNVRHDVSTATLNNSFVGLEDSGSWKNANEYNGEDSSRGNQFAFPSLTCLDLSRNRLTREKGLLTLGFWPVLRKLILHGNPIAIMSKEMPPLLHKYLVKSFGIEVVRTERTKSVKRLPIARQVSASFKRNSIQDPTKLFRRKPRYPKPSCPQLPITEGTHSTMIPRSITLAIGTSSSAETSEHETEGKTSNETGNTTTETSQEQNSENYGKDEKPSRNFFVTQVDLDEGDTTNYPINDDGDSVTSVPSSKPDPFEEIDPMQRKYKGYEELMTLTEDDMLFDQKILPKTVSGTVNQLSHALRYSIVFGKPSIKSSHESAMKVLKRHNISSSSKRGSLVSSKITTTKSEEFTKALERMKTDPFLLEESLDRVLSSKDRKLRRQFSEAPQLMHQVQKKYNEVLSRSIKAISNPKSINDVDINSRPSSITIPESMNGNVESTERLSERNTLEDIRRRVESRL